MELWEIPLKKKVWSVIVHAKQACLIFFHTFYQCTKEKEDRYHEIKKGTEFWFFLLFKITPYVNKVKLKVGSRKNQKKARKSHVQIILRLSLVLIGLKVKFE